MKQFKEKRVRKRKTNFFPAGQISLKRRMAIQKFREKAIQEANARIE